MTEANPTTRSTLAQGAIVRLDLSHLQHVALEDARQARRAWDTLHAASALQGIVNRERPRLWLRFEPNVDDFWWDALRRPGEWLEGVEVHDSAGLEEALRVFRADWRGVVLYPERPWAGSNVASTIAGVEDRVPLRFDPSADSLYTALKKCELWDDAEVFRLCDDVGRPVWNEADGPTEKTRAHRWLLDHYIRNGRVNADILAYYIDAYWLTQPGLDSLPNCTLTNHDYFISRRAAFVDLHVWEEETPVDDPEQPPGYDLSLFRETLKALQQRAAGMIHVGGFTPWRWKYSNEPGAGSRHHGVQTEWKMVKEVSAYNGYLDADAISYAGMTNASFYQHFPRRERYPQTHARKPKATFGRESPARPEADSDVIHVMLYTGDYDSAAWLNRLIPQWWTDPARGTIPLNWAFNPNLDRRAPHVLDFVRRNATLNDIFISGNCGAGYLNPAELSDPRRDPDVPDGWDMWVSHCRSFYRRYDLTITGFIIEGLSEGLDGEGLARYGAVSPDGLIAHRKLPGPGVHDSGMPYLNMAADLGGTPQEAADALLAGLDGDKVPFYAFRTVVQSPSWHAELMRCVSERHATVRFCDAYTFFGALKTSLLGESEQPTLTPVIKRPRVASPRG